MAAVAGRVYPRARMYRPGIDHNSGQHGRLSPDYGRARIRQLRRQRRKRWVGILGRLGGMLWLLAGALLPIIIYQYTNFQAASPALAASQNIHSMQPGGNPIAEIPRQATSTALPPTATPTATPTQPPTPTATPTPLPARLIQATAWQATLDQAAGYSHATQNQAAGQYHATQTALPPILTVNAIQRDGTATATLK